MLTITYWVTSCEVQPILRDGEEGEFCIGDVFAATFREPLDDMREPLRRGLGKAGRALAYGTLRSSYVSCVRSLRVGVAAATLRTAPGSAGKKRKEPRIDLVVDPRLKKPLAVTLQELAGAPEVVVYGNQRGIVPHPLACGGVPTAAAKQCEKPRSGRTLEVGMAWKTPHYISS